MGEGNGCRTWGDGGDGCDDDDDCDDDDGGGGDGDDDGSRDGKGANYGGSSNDGDR